jgi:hypothetical protein
MLLCGSGVALALPLLEAMLPMRGDAADADSPDDKTPGRMGAFYFGTGMNMREFTPADAGRDFTFSRILQPLEAFRGEMTVLSGTYLKHGGNHYGDYTFLTGADAYSAEGIRNTISADQIAAAHLGRQTRFPSLQLSVARGTGLGGSLRTLSWNARGAPLAAESDPHALFERLFGSEAPGAAELRRRDVARRKSVLDAVSAQAARLRGQVGRNDRHALADYFDSVRDLERQLARDEAWLERPKPAVDARGLGDYTRPYSPEQTREFRYETYSRLMYDLIALAFQTDSTRVVTYVVRQELKGGVYPEFGVSKDYHSLSHHNNDPRNLEELAKVDTIYMEHWAYFLRRLQSIALPGGGTLLDRTLLAFSSGMGIGHSRDRLPTVLFGGRALGVAHQGHLKLPDNTPLASLWQTMLERLKVPHSGPLQDSTGLIAPLVA